MPNSDIKTAIIYARVSVNKKDDEKVSIPAQIDKGKEMAAQLGANVSRVFIDEGKSGWKGHRPAFEDALDYCDVYSPTYLITWSTSRFARNRVYAAVAKDRLDGLGVTLKYVSNTIDRETDDGWMLDSMYEIFDEAFSRQVSKDTRRSIMKNAREGYWNGGRAPFGYKPVPAVEDSKRKKLVPVPEEALVVGRIFDLRLDCYGAATIADMLNSDLLYNRNRPWNKKSILSLLGNEAVIGNTVYNRRHRRTNSIRPRELWIVVPSHEPIIRRDKFDAVQEMLGTAAANTNTSPGSPLSHFVFTGLLKCTCGAPLYTESAKGRSKRYHYYNCSVAQKTKTHPSRRLSAPDVDEFLVNVICDHIFSREAIAHVVEELKKESSGWERERKNKCNVLSLKIQKLEGANEKILDLFEIYGRDTPNLADVTKRLRANNTKVETWGKQLQELDGQEQPDVNISDGDIDDVYEFLVETIKTTKDAKKLRTFFQRFILDIEVADTSVDIKYQPEKLLAATHQHVAVPSSGMWLPVQGVLGTVIVTFPLPVSLSKAA